MQRSQKAFSINSGNLFGVNNMNIVISNDLNIPMNVATKRLAFIGTTGSGKSYGAMKLAEEMIAAGIQVVIFDPVGIHWGLRLSSDQKKKGIPITVFGGLYGDIPINPQSGKLVAEVVVNKRVSVVIDVSQFEYDAERSRFVAAFFSRFFFLKKSHPSPVHVMLEEGQEFVPQNPGRGEEDMLHQVVRTWKIGRNFGVGGSIITQRPQEVNKKALNLSQALFAFQTNGAHERKAIEEWMKDKGMDLDIANDLPKLKIGQPHLWSPGWLGVNRGIKILPRKTFHPSEEGIVTYSPEAMNKLSPVDIQRISDSIAEVVEKAKENDPAELKKEISELRHKLRAAERIKPAAVDVEAIKKQIAATYEREMAKYCQGVDRELNTIVSNIKKLIGINSSVKEIAVTMPSLPQLRKFDPPSIKEQKQIGMGETMSSDGVTIGEKKVLMAIAQSKGVSSRTHISVITGYRRSTRDKYLQLLQQKGFVSGTGNEITITVAGENALGSDYVPLPTGRDLIQHWISKLTGGERELFSRIASAQSYTRDQLSDETGYKRSTRDKYLQSLMSRKLIISSGGVVSLNHKYFE